MITRREFLFGTIFLPLVITTATFQSAVGYFVDSVYGNDGNDGLSDLAPFQTISRLLQETIQAGDIINLARDSYWREELSLIVNNLTIQAYGDGERPILDCADIVTGFAKADGYTNVYEVAVSPEFGDNECWLRAWEDDSQLIRASSMADCDSKPGSYYPSSDTVAPMTLYFHPTASDNPATNGKLYEFSQRKFGIDLNEAEGCSVVGIHTTRNLGASGSLKVGRNSLIDDCIASRGSKHNIFIKSGTVVKNTQAIGMYYDLSPAAFVFNDTEANGESFTFENCKVINDTFQPNVTGFFGHRNIGNGEFGSVNLIDCQVVDCALGYSGQHVEQFNFTRCKAANCALGWRMSYAADYNLTDCEQIGGSRAINVTVDGVSTVIRGLVSEVVTANGLINISKNCNLDIQDSTFRATGTSGTRTGIAITGSPSVTLTSRNNHFIGLGTYVYNFAIVPILDSNFNCFDAAKWRYVGINYLNLATWRAATGQDANSTIGGC